MHNCYKHRENLLYYNIKHLEGQLSMFTDLVPTSRLKQVRV